MTHPDPTVIQLPAEPCVIISDGEQVTIITDRTCELVRRWASLVGPIARPIMVARLRAIADYIAVVGDA